MDFDDFALIFLKHTNNEATPSSAKIIQSNQIQCI